MTDVVVKQKPAWTFVKSDGGVWSCENGPSNAVPVFSKLKDKMASRAAIAHIKHEAAENFYPEPVGVEAFVAAVYAKAAAAAEPAEPCVLTNLMPVDPAAIPKRDWLIENLLMRGQVSMLYGMGGSAKSISATRSLYVSRSA